MSDKIDLTGAWGTFFAAFETSVGVGRILTLLSILGVLIVVMALIKWAWDRRRGGGMGQSGAVWGSLLVGALMCAPKILIPVFLFILDAVANAVYNVWLGTQGKG